MSSDLGKNINITIFGQSHSEGIGVVITGLPAGEKIDFDQVQAFLDRRAPGKSGISTARRETDIPQIQSGILNDTTCGAPLCAVFQNNDTRSGDYENTRFVPRPGHADFPAFVKYKGFQDIRGGGHFSARLTVGLCFAGAICMQLLERRGVLVGAHILSVADVFDEYFPAVGLNSDILLASSKKILPVLDDGAGERMKEKILEAKRDCDSVGGIVECAAIGLPAGLGDTIFGSVEGRLSQAVFGIPAVKGIEFGAGFSASSMRGSQNNDEYYYDGALVRTVTNNHGGILGGLTTGMPVIFRAAFKPTPSIAKKQASVDLIKGENTCLEIKGRHDPCVVPRAVPCVEAAAAVTLLDLLLDKSESY